MIKRVSSFIIMFMFVCVIPLGGNCRADDISANATDEIPLVQDGYDYYVRPKANSGDDENAYVIMLPVSAVIGEYADISWSDGSVNMHCGTLDVYMQIGETDYVINGEDAVLDAPPEIIDGMTYVPATFFEKTFGFWTDEAGEGAIDLFIPSFIIENI